jgi:REP element-mobilizing transposase RayT
MSSHFYHEIFLHLNWHTKENRALLRGRVEQLTYQVLTDKCRHAKGVYLHGLGGTDDHVHLALSLEPSVTLSELVQKLKGGTSHDVNQLLAQKLLEWQRGYGVVSFGKAHLDWVLDYIKHQREHHASGRLEARLEMWEATQEAAIEKPG